MHYRGRHKMFDPSRIRTEPLAGRTNKVRLGDLVTPDVAPGADAEPPAAVARLAEAIAEARRNDRAVICFTGAHLIKNGLGPLLADLVERGVVTLVAGNGATAIHDVELALIGETSEHVPRALPEGRFGMAWEFGLINAAMRVGDADALGLGEALGRTIRDDAFRGRVLAEANPPAGAATDFAHPEVSVLARCHDRGVPMTVHVGIGTDVIDQHPNADGRAKGGTSMRDFLIFTDAVTRLAGGVFLNIGSAVTGPEVLLKAVSMASNAGAPPEGLTTADLDLRPHRPEQMADEAAAGYYFRDQKSVVTRVPAAFGGEGLYIHGDQRTTFPLLYHALRRAT